MQSAGHLMVQTLEAHGVERVYTVPGESFLDILDGLHDSSISTVVCRQEGGAGFMALAEGRLGNADGAVLPGVAMVTRGPGAANAMIAVHTAYQDATALVLFVGLVPIRDRSRESFQEFSIHSWFGSTAKRVLTLEDADQAGTLVAEAMQVAASGRPGPVVIGVPEDVLRESTSAEAPEVRPIAAPIPAEAELDALAERLRAASKPMIVVGGDGWHGDDGARVLAFAARAGVPVLADFRSYDAVPHHGEDAQRAWGGMLGYGRGASMAVALDEADLLICIGATRSDVMSEGYTASMDAETVVALPDPSLLQHAGRLDQLILATPHTFAQALERLDGADVRGSRDDTWMLGRADAQRRFSTAPTEADPEAGLDLDVAFGELERALPADRAVTYGAGNATIWGHRYLSHETSASLVGARNGAMGLAVPAAIAAAFLRPDRPAVAVCGDGDFLMNGQEVATAVANHLPVLFLVVDNSRYGTIVQHQEREYPGRVSGTDLQNPDFGAWIRAYETDSAPAFGARVTSNEEFSAALGDALAALEHGPALLHLVIDRNTMPKNA